MSLPQIILVPGLLNDAELWRDQTAPLSRIGRPVVADITRADTLDEMTSQVLALAEPEFVLIGFSLGGIVALNTLRTVPDRVTHLGLLNTTAEPDSPKRLAERQRLVSLARSPGQFHGFGEKVLQSYLSPANRGNATFRQRIRGMTSRLGAEVFIRQSLVARPDHRSLLPTIACPTLVLCGDKDQITPPDSHRGMAALIPGATLTILPGSGHMTPIEQPDMVSEAIETLIRRDRR